MGNFVYVHVWFIHFRYSFCAQERLYIAIEIIYKIQVKIKK